MQNLLNTGAALIKRLPELVRAGARASGRVASGFDELFSEVTRRIGRTTEVIEDRMAERRSSAGVSPPRSES